MLKKNKKFKNYANLDISPHPRAILCDPREKHICVITYIFSEANTLFTGDTIKKTTYKIFRLKSASPNIDIFIKYGNLCVMPHPLSSGIKGKHLKYKSYEHPFYTNSCLRVHQEFKCQMCISLKKFISVAKILYYYSSNFLQLNDTLISHWLLGQCTPSMCIH